MGRAIAAELFWCGSLLVPIVYFEVCECLCMYECVCVYISTLLYEY